MTQAAYFHGYSDAEQRRLVAQAEYWRHTLIPIGLEYQPGERVLEIGCGAGAALAVLADTFPGVRLAGIDREPRQIEFAHEHLARREAHPGTKTAEEAPDLRVGDASALPWPDGAFDHVFVMWFIEHLADPLPILREARRVLRAGGTIASTETDYTTFKVTPQSADWDLLEAAQYAFFARHGNPIAGRQLGNLLSDAGFSSVSNRPVGFHFFAGEGGDGLRRHVEYVADFMAPGIRQLAALGYDHATLERGIEHLRRVPALPGGSLTTIVYRARGRRP
jgi:ubiquinone/menaquinone biosynthesis C-methylase UbiE